MIKLIRLKGKKHNPYYICDGLYCNKCKLRFECYTAGEEIELDWQQLHKDHNGSPSMVLKELIGGKVYVQHSKKFKELADKIAACVVTNKDDNNDG